MTALGLPVAGHGDAKSFAIGEVGQASKSELEELPKRLSLRAGSTSGLRIAGIR